MSHFGGPGWTLDEATGQDYYHSFLREQPDLNWRNPEVREAMYAAMRFWLEKGVDGFRMDVLWLLIKDDQFRDNPPNPDYSGGSTLNSVLPKYTADQPETLEIVAEMRALLDSYHNVGGERVLIGEIYLPIQELVAYYGVNLLGAQMPFNFWLIQTAWQAPLLAELINRYEAALPAGAWPNWVLGNHDQKRLASRVGAAQARVAAMLLLTLRGTPTLYYGDELGMPDARIAPDEVVDPAEKNQPGIGQGRDPERSPMLWENRENAGFTTAGVKTWLPLVWDWPRFTVETERSDAGTMLKLYQRLLRLRREREELFAGEILEVSAEAGVLRFVRECRLYPPPPNKSESIQNKGVKSGLGYAESCTKNEAPTFAGRRLQVLLNLSGESRTVECEAGRVLVRTGLDREDRVSGSVELRGNEGLVVEVAATL
jgi:alpha-glucosidase